jgi:hypothetical protein
MTTSQAPYRRFGPVAALIVLAIMAGCKSSDSSGGTGPGPTPAISITLSANSATVAQGGSTQVTATLVRSGGFAGTVNLTVTGTPTGVTGAVSNVVDAGGTSTGTITIQVAGTVAAGTYTITVRGSGSGVSDATATFALTVTAFGFTITAQPAAISIPAGGQGTVDIAINRIGGFAGSVGMVGTTTLAGLVPTISPASTTGNSAVMTLAVPANAAAGTYTVAIGAAATGVTSQSATIALTVTAGSTGSGNASVNMSCFQVLWFAYQDGSGPWTPVTGASGVYGFNITASKGGYTYVIQQGAVTQTVVQYLTRSEMTTAPINLCPATATTKTVNGTVTGMGATDFANFWLGGGSGIATTNGAFSITNVQQGTQDFVGYRHDNLKDVTGSGNADRAVLRRDQNIAAGGSVGAVDFNAGDSFAPATANVTVAGAAGGEQITSGMAYYTTAACTYASLYAFAGFHATPTFTASGIPAAMQRGTDYHQIYVTGVTSPSQLAPPTATRTVEEWFHTLGDRTITLPAQLPAPTLSTLTGPYLRLQAVYTVPGDYQLNTIFAYTESTGFRFASVSASLGYLGSTSAMLALPDFSSLANWNNAWPPASGSTGTWFTNANGNNLGAGGVCTENARVVGATQLGTY